MSALDAPLLLAALREQFQEMSDALVDWRMTQFTTAPEDQRRAIADERLADLADRLIFGDEPTIHDLRADEADRRYSLDREAS